MWRGRVLANCRKSHTVRGYLSDPPVPKLKEESGHKGGRRIESINRAVWWFKKMKYAFI